MVKTLLLIVAAVAVAACKPQEPQEPGQAGPCDSRVAERQRWFTTPHEEYDGQKPSAGFSVLGSCTDKLVDRRISCDKAELRDSVGGKPHLHDALALGFKTYVCELTSDQRRTEYPLADVLTKRAPERFTVRGVMARMEVFKGDMCRCKAGDRACADKVEQALKDYSRSMKDTDLDQKSISPDDEKKMGQIISELVKCQETALGSGDNQSLIEDAISKVKGFKDDMCRCKAGDKACAEKVEQALTGYLDSVTQSGLKPRPVTADDEQRMAEAMAGLLKCQQAAMGTSGTGAP
jgi:hypothetical protein